MVEPIDPAGFNMYAQLVVAGGGDTFPLWMRGAGGSPDSEFPDDPGAFFRGDRQFLDLPILQSVDIELNLGLNGKINIEVGAPFDLGLALLESQLFTIGNTIQVRLGYPKTGRFTPWFGGMNAKPSLRIDPDNGLSATLNIEGAGFAALRSVSSDPFASQTYKQIISAIAVRHGWDVVEPEATTGPEPDPYESTRVTVSQGNMSDFLFLRHVARQANMDFWLGPSPLGSDRTAVHLHRRTDIMGGRPKYTFVARGQSDFVNTFPMFTFESEADGVWLPRGSGLVRCSDIDPGDRTEVTEEVSPDTSDVTASADAQVGDGSAEVGGHISRARLAPDAQTAGEWYSCSSRDPMTPLERIRSHSTEQNMRGGINATISSFGIPDLVPGDVIRIEELGVFGGNYGIQGVSHHAAAGEWTMTLTLLSNAASVSAIADHLARAPVRFNAETPIVTSDVDGGGDVSEGTPVVDGDTGG